MPIRTTYPAATDLAALLVPWTKRLAQEDVDSLDFESAVGSARERWERETGYRPFLAQAGVRRYDPPGPEKGPVGVYVGLSNVGGGRRLFLTSGITSLESVTTGIRDAVPGIAGDSNNPAIPAYPGVTLVLNFDYYLRPEGARDYDRPYSYIEFRAPQYGNPHSIEVKGVFGYADALPEDAWAAILRAAAIEIAPQLEFLLVGLIKSWASGTTKEEYFPKPFAEYREMWEQQYARALNRYVRKALL